MPETAHVPTSGRMTELLVPGRTVWLSPHHHPHRKTPYDLTLVEHQGRLVCIDSRAPNVLMAEHLHQAGWHGRQLCQVSREVTVGASRLDLMLEDALGVVWMEVKSVTLAEDGLALFPDAPTTRGARHLEELINVVNAGGRAAVAFVAQRADAERFAPHGRNDRLFAETLARAASAGVALAAYACRVSHEEIAIAHPIPIQRA
jgi:sugar fermentation stimulation protein A